MILVTGGAGFIGSNFVLEWLAQSDEGVVNVDKLTYAGNLQNLASLEGDGRHVFARADICDRAAIDALLATHRPRAIVHFAAESHVDRSILGPEEFVRTNVVGTFTLLEAARSYWNGLEDDDKAGFRFLHVSTDEVYGTLGPEGLFTETTPYSPNSPYSASKASSDHLVRAWFHTYGLPTLITNCSNNYGPYQYPEKLIPVVILNALEGKPIPVYGRGENVRDWLYVYDHVRALLTVLERGEVGQTYNIGGSSERKNIEVVETICTLLDELAPNPSIGPHASLITFVQDRPGHDFRYAIDASKLERELGWKPLESFESGMQKTVAWYLEHLDWCETVTRDKYLRERLGLRIDAPADLSSGR